MINESFTLTDTLLKANSKGSTFFQLSEEKHKETPVGTPCHLIIINNKGKEILRTFAKVARTRQRNGFTPPKHLTKHLIGTKLTTTITPLSEKGWITKIGSDNRINIPFHIIEQNKWKDNNLIEIKIQQPNNLKQTTKSIIRLFSRKRPKQKQETTAILHAKDTTPFEGRKIYVTPLRKLQKPTKPRKLTENTIWIPDLFPNAQIGEIQEGIISLHLGRHFPIQIPISFKLGTIAHYMGCYFADGDKSANTCGISASTIEQANYYLEMQKLIIPTGESYRFDITYTKLKTDNRSDDVIKKEIISYWKNNVPLNGPLSFKLRLSIAKSKPTKWNESGTIRIRGRSSATLFLIKYLLSWTVNQLIIDQYYTEGLDFFCGILEGDGSPGDPCRGGNAFLRISTNAHDVKSIVNILDRINLSSNMNQQKNRAQINLGILQYLKVLPDIHDLVFKYYPKRRRRFIDRFFSQAIIKKMFQGNRILKYNFRSELIKENIIDSKGNYTSLGYEIINTIKILSKQ